MKKKNLVHAIKQSLHNLQYRIHKFPWIKPDPVLRSTISHQVPKSQANNPYLRSRMLWNELYGSVQVKLENAKRILVIQGIALGIAIVGLIILGSQSHLKPYVVQLSGSDVMAVNTQSASFQELVPQLAVYFAKQFIQASHDVSLDGQVNQQNALQAFSMVKDEARGVLSQFYDRNDPNRIAENLVRSVHITSVLPLSDHSLEIHWNDEDRDLHTGELTHSQNYIARIRYGFAETSENQTILKLNPLGFYIDELSWTEAEV